MVKRDMGSESRLAPAERRTSAPIGPDVVFLLAHLRALVLEMASTSLSWTFSNLIKTGQEGYPRNVALASIKATVATRLLDVEQI
jgi:hypothetical protein